MRVCSVCKIEQPLEDYPRDKRKKEGRSYRCKACNKIKNKRYYEANKADMNRKRTERRKDNPAQDEYDRQYREANKDHLNELQKVRYHKKKHDPVYAMSIRARNRVRRALKENKDRESDFYLGCSYHDLAKHLEGQFVEGMSWENMGKWHIDHVVPIASASTLEELYPLLHFTNLQPLWAKDNLSKGKKQEE